MALPSDDTTAAILGDSPAAESLRHFARSAAAVDASVLLTGETGTGKGVLARAIHAASARSRARFVPVNCAGVPATLFESAFFGHVRGAFTGAHQTHRGFFEQAHGGTLFLDEIGLLDPALQAKLLTALEDGEIRRVGAERSLRADVRLVAATNASLERRVARCEFRADLFYRINVLRLRVPPLRERGDDVLVLARAFLDRLAHRYRRACRGFEPAAERRLLGYAWPGNVRELAHAVEAAVLSCDRPQIRVLDLPEVVRGERPVIADDPDAPAPGPTARDAGGRAPLAWPRYAYNGPPAQERARILDALDRCRGNRTRAAALLGMSRGTLRAKLRTHGLDPSSPGSAKSDPSTPGRG